MTDPVPEITDLQNKIDEAEFREMKLKMAQLEIRQAELEVRVRSKRRLLKVTVGVGLFLLACWYVGYTVYTLLH